MKKRTSGGPLVRVGARARIGFGRIVPEPFVIAVGLTTLVLVTALAVGTPPAEVLRAWSGGAGLWALLSFTMQMCVMLVLGTALATASPVQRGIAASVGWVRSPRQLVGATAFIAIGLALLNWSLGLIGGAIVAREAGRIARLRGYSLHYPLLCAAGYSGLMTWHGGLSGSAPLKVTTAEDLAEVLGPALAEQVGVLDLHSTLLSPLNLVVSGGLLVLGPLVFMGMTPATDPDAQPAPEPPGARLPPEAPPDGLVERVERSGVFSMLLALPLCAALAMVLAEGGLLRLSFNTVNLALFAFALLLHGRPDRFLRACEEGARSCGGVIVQFPLYAGVMGVMKAAGLAAALAGAFSQVGPGTFEALAFGSAGLLNLFVPSGGGQWAVQGPVLMQGAVATGIEPGRVVMAMAYGDQWTNMLQPFWALPLLAITGVRARDIIGYAAVWMAAGGLWMFGNLAIG
ncbi:MAG: TIGR00366 family protein [Nannocystales bacterium]